MRSEPDSLARSRPGYLRRSAHHSHWPSTLTRARSWSTSRPSVRLPGTDSAISAFSVRYTQHWSARGGGKAVVSVMGTPPNHIVALPEAGVRFVGGPMRGARTAGESRAATAIGGMARSPVLPHDYAQARCRPSDTHRCCSDHAGGGLAAGPHPPNRRGHGPLGACRMANCQRPLKAPTWGLRSLNGPCAAAQPTPPAS